MFAHLVENTGWRLEEICGQLRKASSMAVSTTEVKWIHLHMGLLLLS